MPGLKKCLTAVMAGVLLTSCTAAAAEESEQVITVDPQNAFEVNEGVFEGWGTSLCWWANRIGYSDALTRLAAEAFCDPEKGLGLIVLNGAHLVLFVVCIVFIISSSFTPFVYFNF